MHFQGFLKGDFPLLQDPAKIMALGEVIDDAAGIDFLLQLFALDQYGAKIIGVCWH